MKRVLMLLVLLTVFSVPISAGQAADAAVLAENFRLPVVEHVLDNGMRFLIVERRESPTFSAYMRFKVGSVNSCLRCLAA